MIEVTGVGKRYGDVAALQGVDLRVGRGDVVGLLGPNGAGKTTLIRILTGFFEPSAGRVTIDGVDVVQDPVEARRRIGYLPEQSPVYPEMLVQEYLWTMAELRQIPEDQRLRLIAEAVDATDLRGHLTRPIAELSKGFRQRVGLAQAILHRPKLLILDEPTSGLDPTQVDQVRELIARLSRTTTVLFSTHILSEVEQVCDRAVILLGGQVRADARLEELRSGGGVVAAVAAEDPALPGEVGDPEARPDWAVVRRIEDSLRALPGVSELTRVPGRDGYRTWRLTGAGDLGREVFRLARDRGWELGELRPVVRDLESVFRDLVRAHEAGRAAA